MTATVKGKAKLGPKSPDFEESKTSKKTDKKKGKKGAAGEESKEEVLSDSGAEKKGDKRASIKKQKTLKGEKTRS